MRELRVLEDDWLGGEGSGASIHLSHIKDSGSVLRSRHEKTELTVILVLTCDVV